MGALANEELPMIGYEDPGRMTPEERLREIAAILAEGYVRHRTRIPAAIDRDGAIDTPEPAQTRTPKPPADTG